MRELFIFIRQGHAVRLNKNEKSVPISFEYEGSFRYWGKTELNSETNVDNDKVSNLILYAMKVGLISQRCRKDSLSIWRLLAGRNITLGYIEIYADMWILFTIELGSWLWNIEKFERGEGWEKVGRGRFQNLPWPQTSRFGKIREREREKGRREREGRFLNLPWSYDWGKWVCVWERKKQKVIDFENCFPLGRGNIRKTRLAVRAFLIRVRECI